jgi:hypothetical protein
VFASAGAGGGGAVQRAHLGLQLKTMLDSLQKANNNAMLVAEEWTLAHPNTSNKVPFCALVGEHETCKILLENFWKGS